ncbi:extracellular solute-binding protein [Geovibrio thiophilus]|uniref:Extracellular solute-binding protein n=1 Tax=Geovibrio thiophilus TaxID=139438 RepID=A0A3R5V2C7_9BACT|nr:extracellular solute-binding protein [Geovibrio thiophilus]QAR33879.1 extracellular solute-binding protein [Geovibrio thiophilus]
MKIFQIIALTLVMTVSAFAAGKELYLYNWSEYMPEEVIQKFQKETGIKVIYNTYDSNEAMYAKVKLISGKGYDLIVPSTYYVSKMKKENLLARIDKSKISNFKNLEKSLLNKPYDPGNDYSVPYLWGSTGISYNADKVKDKVDSWSVLWKPQYKGKILLTDDVREVFQMALVQLGYSGNTIKEAEIKAAYELLRKLMPSVRTFNSESPKVPYINGEVTIGMNWNGEAFLAQEEMPSMRYVYPKEGVILWMDNFAIPKNAKNINEAHTFINFVLRPDIAKIISEEIGYATPNREGKKLLDEEVRNNPTSYPSEAIVAKGEFQEDVGDAILIYEKYWEMLKTGK